MFGTVPEQSGRKDQEERGAEKGQKAGGAGLEHCDIVNRSRETERLAGGRGEVGDRASSEREFALQTKPVGADAR